MTTEPAEPSTGPPPLEGDLIRLRAVERTDVEWVNAHFWNPNVTRFLEAVWPESTAATEAYLSSARASDTSFLFLIETLGGERAGVLRVVGQPSQLGQVGLDVGIAQPQRRGAPGEGELCPGNPPNLADGGRIRRNEACPAT